ncbi:hypothetical protein BOX15_Mlig003839g1 [Macrostomum lignano]|uniref:Major facilitator superfamily (MFS) profile domain-containing protein n=1 Tax=Macrostomum lignano TaxID=282301 RepID=A0A267DJ02_9PLAT|nr:hypothetical protein BOX15_Mlig003839g2 [Macrostomum lignano]PAA49309.1 hypothetical protein BOX15_Mlig003839g1 [Macrostomum lignano]
MTLNFDDLLKQIGGFGRAQLLIFLVPALIAILSGFHTLAPIYLLYTPEYRCRPQSGIGSNRSTLNESVAQNLESIGKCSYGNETGPACHEWIYDQTEFASTFVTEFNLVCKNALVGTWIKTCTFAGFMVGVFVTGFLSDLLGRRRCLIACLCLYGSAALGSAFCQSPVAMALTRFFIGFGAMGAFTVSFVIGTEIVGPEARFHTGMAIEYFWTLGSCAVAGLAYLIHDWRHLQLVLSAPVLLVLVASLPPAVVPESPRWLLHKGRVNEARDVIRRMARLNRATVDIGRELDSVLEGDGPDNGGGGGRSTEKVTPSLTEASTDCAAVRVDDGSGQRSEPRWRHRFRAAAVAARQLICQAPRLLAEYCIICFNWFSIALVYYGLIMGSGTLPGSIFLTSLLTAMVEFPAYILGHATVNRLGRKVVCVAFNSLSAVSLFGLLLVVLLAPGKSQISHLRLFGLASPLLVASRPEFLFAHRLKSRGAWKAFPGRPNEGVWAPVDACKMVYI